MRFFSLVALLALLSGCGNSESDTTADTSTNSTETADVPEGIGTYEAFFVYRMEDGTRDTSDVVTGSIPFAYEMANGTAIDLAGHTERTTFNAAERPLPYGMEDSAYLMTYINERGERVLYATNPSTTRQLSADTSNTMLHAFTIAPMWHTEASEHATRAIDRAEGDTLGVFSVAGPDMDAAPAVIDGSAAASHESVQIFVTVEWNGDAHPVGIAWRGHRGGWWANLLEDDPRAVARPNTSFLKRGLAMFEEDARVYLVPLAL